MRDPVPEDRMKEIDSLLKHAVEKGSVPAVAAAAADREGVFYRGGFGKLGDGQDTPVTENTIFRIASMTKPVTSAAVMMLEEEGILSLDDPIIRWLPTLASRRIISGFDEKTGTIQSVPAQKEITIRHLLAHTSGLGYGFSNELLHRIFQTTGKLPMDLPLLHEPGSAWTYGMGYRLLGELIELLSGRDLEGFFKEKIFDPLGMKDTFFTLPEDRAHSLVSYYRRSGGVLNEGANPREHEAVVSGSGGLLSTAPDFLRFCRMLLNGGVWKRRRILKVESVKGMMTNQIGELTVALQNCPDPAYSRPFPDGAGRDKFGLGVQITAGVPEKREGRAPGSCSWAGLLNTHFWIDPARGVAAVVLMQLLPFYDESAMDLYHRFERHIYRGLR